MPRCRFVAEKQGAFQRLETIMSEWYYRALGETIGPVSWLELEQKAGDGEITHETEVREGADGPWTAASQVPGLVDVPAEPAHAAAAGAASGGEVPAEASPAGAAQQGEQEVGVRRSPLNLRPCSDCGTMVSKQASTCPQCGRAFHESAFTARYGGEQPVLMFVLISLLALAFLFLSPLAVYWIAAKLAPSVIRAGDAGDLAHTGFALVVVGLYVFAMLSCTFLGGAVGRPRMAYVTGCLLGLFFGPLGVFTAFAIDKRPQCPQCSTRLNGLAQECPSCHARLVWKVVPTWY
jgi:hypothetical protein